MEENEGKVGTWEVVYKSEQVTMNVYVVNSHNHGGGSSGHHTGNKLVDAFIDQFGLGSTEYLRYINGYEDGTFKTYNEVTRGEIATILAKIEALQLPMLESVYRDLEEEYWAYEAIQQVSEQNWLVGYEDHTFRPDEEMTRVEAVTALNRIYRTGYVFDQTMYELLFTDVETTHWGYEDILKASVTHTADLDRIEDSNE